MSDPALSPTFSERPTDEDRLRCRLLGLLDDVRPGHDTVETLIQAGVTLPPEPELPQGRFYVGAGGSVLDRLSEGGSKAFAQVYPPTADWRAERVAALLNADEECDGDLSKVKHAALTRTALKSTREKLAEAEVRVKELEGELAEARSTPPYAPTCDDCPGGTDWQARAEEAERKLAEATADPTSLLPQEAPPSCDTCGGPGRLVVDEPYPYAYDGPCIDCSPARSDEAQPAEIEGVSAGDASPTGIPSTQPTQPLFTGKFLGVWSAGTTAGYPHARIGIGSQGDAAALRHDQEVDVYARGARPAPRAITADDVAIARGRSRAFESTWAQDMADALNARLADAEAEA